MTFGPYEIFSILSGIVLVLGACIPELEARDRVVAVLGGLFFVIYGLYVAAQTTGTWTFPVAIFVIPFLGAGALVWRMISGRSESRTIGAPSSAGLSSTGPRPTTFAGVHAPTHAGERRCVNNDCDFYGRATRRVTCLRCERPTAGASLDVAGRSAPVPARRFAQFETRCCHDVRCGQYQIRTADLVCRGCRADTGSAEPATA